MKLSDKDVKELIKKFNVSRATIYRWFDKGIIVKVNGEYKVAKGSKRHKAAYYVDTYYRLVNRIPMKLLPAYVKVYTETYDTYNRNQKFTLEKLLSDVRNFRLDIIYVDSFETLCTEDSTKEEILQMCRTYGCEVIVHPETSYDTYVDTHFMGVSNKDVDNICNRYDVCVNTVFHWIKRGKLLKLGGEYFLREQVPTSSIQYIDAMYRIKKGLSLTLRTKVKTMALVENFKDYQIGDKKILELIVEQVKLGNITTLVVDALETLETWDYSHQEIKEILESHGCEVIVDNPSNQVMYRCSEDSFGLNRFSLIESEELKSLWVGR